MEDPAELQLYRTLRLVMGESELQALLAAVRILRSSPSMNDEQRRLAAALWNYVYVLDPERPLVPLQRLDFSLWSTEKWRSHFRFAPQHLTQLRELLRIDYVFHTDDGHRMLGDEAILLLLRRMSSGQRHVDLEDLFSISSSTSSTITVTLLRRLHELWHNRIFCADVCFTAARLRQYAAAIAEKVYLLTGVHWPTELGWFLVAFLDGTHHTIDRPSDEFRDQNLQESAYSGYEKGHGLRLHHLLFACGIIGHVSPLIPGRMNDAVLWKQSLYELIY